jgi:hypothetical protein
MRNDNSAQFLCFPQQNAVISGSLGALRHASSAYKGQVSSWISSHSTPTAVLDALKLSSHPQPTRQVIDTFHLVF